MLVRSSVKVLAALVSLAVLAHPECDIGLVGYEMALLVSRTEATLTPQLVSEMRSRLPVAGAVRAGAGG